MKNIIVVMLHLHVSPPAMFIASATSETELHCESLRDASRFETKQEAVDTAASLMESYPQAIPLFFALDGEPGSETARQFFPPGIAEKFAQKAAQTNG